MAKIISQSCSFEQKVEYIHMPCVQGQNYNFQIVIMRYMPNNLDKLIT
jgi:hypothetical protein